MMQIKNALGQKNVGKVSLNEPLHKHTTIKIGGPADIFIEPNSIESIKTTVAILRESQIPIRVIGRGSNLLISDEGIRGAVIKFGKGMDHLVENGNRITVGGGYPLVGLSTIMSKKGRDGLAFAGGIPGSVGGAVYMNAGAHGSDIGKILVKAHILFPDGTTKWLTNKEMRFSYRKSILQEEPRGYCVEAVFHLNEGNKEEIRKKMKRYKAYRKETQPWDLPCCGSVFRNPLPHHAGALVEQLGLKGKKIGGAKISELHGNFIVNDNNATFKDVMELINYIKESVKTTYNIILETEVEIIKN
ncbi:UDP-N-acetylmuramate dehydrogenase [Salirhabdus sp. Marseille-P4669]|uniref:UDP-N-acetylmuramate dehydrogenase n=1 Tax=Salirhabdus sp. Marseille-P4669 TaxID=2042310 RepID=UPI000C7D720C|nr:UDP-N-acetylmuramate dehydrogenase [Salirhabdus sp. Marseille-P4669]